MVVLPVLPLLIPCIASPAPLEPDGSRTLGIVPPFRAEPAPPAWLRRASHLLAWGPARTRHYVYEVYADGGGRWLVRYVHLPDATEDPSERQQAFLFCSDPLCPPLELRPETIRFKGREARWRSKAFSLVDRRDLIRGPISFPNRCPAAPRP